MAEKRQQASDGGEVIEAERPIRPSDVPYARVVQDPLRHDNRASRPFRLVLAGTLGAALVLISFLIAPGWMEQEAQTASEVVRETAPPSVPNVTGNFTLRTLPEGAEVAINSQAAGTTPLFDAPLRQGSHMLSLRMDGFRSIDTLITIRADERLQMLLALRPDRVTRESIAPEVQPEGEAEVLPASLSTLDVFSNPPGAEILIDGRPVGTTPARGLSLEEGEYALRLIRAGYEPAEYTVSLSAEEPGIIEADLVARTGTVRVLVLPWGSIFINDELRAEDTDLRHELVLAEGMHRIRAEHPVLGSIEREVRVLPGETLDVIMDLNE